MPRFVVLATLLFAVSQSVNAAEATPTFADAMRAYYAKDYAACASILVDLSRIPDPKLSRIAYNAACCHALNGNAKAAFKSLEHAISNDLVGVKTLDQDADLASLRGDAAWPAFRARAAQLEIARMIGIDRVLRDELLARVENDQAARNRLTGPAGQDPVLNNRVDRDNAAWMRQVIATRGWPGRSLVLKDGAKAAWLLVQHADGDLPLQKQALELLADAVAKGEAEAADLAYLTDRVLVAEAKPQRYGTQFHMVDGKLVPQPIENQANVDLLRAFAGLPSLAEYKKVMQQK